MGTASNSAIQKYMKRPEGAAAFVASYTERWNDPKIFHGRWVWNDLQNEGGIYATYILKEKPDAKNCGLYQNDDAGKDFLRA